MAPTIGTPHVVQDGTGAHVTVTIDVADGTSPLTVSASTSGGCTSVQVDVTPPPPPPPVPATLGYIGDSLTYQAGSGAVKASLLAAGWTDANLKVDGLTGRGIPLAGVVHPNTGEVIDSWRSVGFDPATWVIALGSNNLGSTDAQWASYIGPVLDKLAAGPRASYVVYWVGLALRDDPADPRALRFQAVLETLVGTRPKITLRPLDWNSRIHDGRDETGLWLTSDTTGRHMTAAGYDVRNAFITGSI